MSPVDPVQVAIRRVTPEDVEKLFFTLQSNAQVWLDRCSIATYWELYSWIKHHGNFVMSVPSGVIFISHWEAGLSVRLHPVIWGKQYCLSSTFSKEVLRAFHKECYTERIEVVIPVDAPRNLERWAERAGFRHEGLHRMYAIWKHRPTDANVYSITAKEME